MKTIISVITIFALVFTIGITISEAGESSKLYTAHNIWKASKMKCINFKQGTDIIPAGTEVKDVRLKKGYSGSPLLYFTTVQDGQKYTISFTQRWHPKVLMEDCKDMMFTTKNLEAQTEGLSEMEIDAIKKGVLVNGMSKRAVFICYGRPPEHFTPKLVADTWFYWMNRADKVEIKFDQDGRLDLIDSKAAKEAETDESIIQSGSASRTQMAVIPEINKKEPWTGLWNVEKSSGGGEQWGLKQHGNKVISTKESSYTINGKIMGNRLKGRRARYYLFDIRISSDGMSFEGTIDCPVNKTCIIKGMRKE